MSDERRISRRVVPLCFGMGAIMSGEAVLRGKPWLPPPPTEENLIPAREMPSYIGQRRRMPRSAGAVINRIRSALIP